MPVSVRTTRSALAAAAFIAMAGIVSAESPVHGSLFGTDSGIFRISKGGQAESVLQGIEAKKIIFSDKRVWVLSDKGILTATDARGPFEERNAGIPVKTVKTFKQGVKALHPEMQDLKDLEIDPFNASNLVVCGKDTVFYSLDEGISWKSLPSPWPVASGLKAVAISSCPEIVIYASHPITGLFACRPGLSGKGAWEPFNEGLAVIPGTTLPDEISDIRVVKTGESAQRLLVGCSFQSRLSEYDFSKKRFTELWSDAQAFNCSDSLQLTDKGIGFIALDKPLLVAASMIGGNPPASDIPAWERSTASGYASAPPSLRAPREKAGAKARPAATPAPLPAAPWTEAEDLMNRADSAGIRNLSCVAVPGGVTLTELWLLQRGYRSPYWKQAMGKEGLYLQTGFVNNKLPKYESVIKAKGLNMVVVDIKDDYGNLRYVPRDDFVRSVGKTKGAMDIEAFTKRMKDNGVYVVGRIVVFKDEVVYRHSGGAYAVWDGKTNKAWQGYFMRKIPAPSGAPVASPASAPSAVATGAGPAAGGGAASPAAPVYEKEFMKEFWVDPYCEQVWRYNVDIAKEIVSRGFDEVQFDYIRFPTDGDNLNDARFRFKDPGMDKDSAIMSFLAFARENIAAPISIDIYGANGWYRTGARTGQDVEILSRYVDVICPMLYPSHFEQDFYAMDPAELRPWRIYYYGSLRNTCIGRYRTIVRPWIQAFYMNVRYDKKYYGLDYVKREIDGVRQATNAGFTYWNNAGRYDDIPAPLANR